AVRAKYGLDGGPWLLTVSRLDWHKGIDTVIKALPAVRAAVPGARYAVAGVGTVRPHFERLVADCGMGDAVRFLGFVPDDELPALYNAVDVYVGASRRYDLLAEGFGIAIVEASACGLPVVGGRAGGVPDAVRDGETGILVDPDDAAAVAHGITRLLDDAELRRRMGAAGGRAVETYYNWDRVARELTEIDREFRRPDRGRLDGLARRACGLRRGRRPRADRVGGAVADELAIDWGPLLVRPRHHGLALGVEHEHPRRRLYQARAAPDAALPLHAHRDGAARKDSGVARAGPLRRPVQLGGGRAVAFFHHLAQVVEVEGRDVLDARVDVVDRRCRPLAQPQLEQRLYGDLGGAREHRGEPLFLGVGAERVRGGHVHREDQIGAEDARRAHGQVVERSAVHVEAPPDLARRQVPRQRAGSEHGVPHRHFVEPVEPPEHLHP